MQDACVMSVETGPGWRELLETLYAQLEASQEREAGARERERFLTRLLEEERRELQRWREGRTAAVQTTTLVVPRRQPRASVPAKKSPVHAHIREVLAAAPDGLLCSEIEAAMGVETSLTDVLRGLARRGRLWKVAGGRYTLPPGQGETTA